MNITNRNQPDQKVLLSTLWIFVLLNILFRDIHELFRQGALEEIINGQVSEMTLLIAAIVLQIPLTMVVLPHLMPVKITRWANIIAAVFMIVISLTNGVNDLDDMWFLAVEVTALSFIFWTSWHKFAYALAHQNETKSIKGQYQ